MATRLWTSVMAKSVFDFMSCLLMSAGEMQTACRKWPRGFGGALTRSRSRLPDIFGPGVACTHRPVPRGDIACLAFVLTSLVSVPAFAQPIPSEAMDGYNAVASYIRDLDESAAAPPGLPSVDAAGVIVSLEGEIVGEGFAAASSANDRRRVAFQALRRAMVGTRRAVARSGASPDDLMISVEFSGPPVSLLGGDLNAPASDWQLGVSGPSVRPGIEGVIVRVVRDGGSIVATRSPTWMLRRGIGPTGAVHACVAELSDDPALAGLQVPDLANRGFSFSTYKTVHLAQLEPRGGPAFLSRGGHYVDLALVSSNALPRFGERLASHLRSRAWPGGEPYGMLGSLDATRGRYTPPIAAPAEQAFAVSAMFAWARAPWLTETERNASLEFAQGVLDDLAERDEVEPDPTGSVVYAAATFVALTSPGAERTEKLVGLTNRCVAVVRPVLPDAGAGAGLPLGVRGLIALAAVRMHTVGELSLEDAASSVAAAYEASTPESLVALMPFLGLASVELSEAEGAPVRASRALREMRQLTDRFRVQAEDVDGLGRDLVGGIVFLTGGTPLPTWQTLRPVVFESVMLGHAELTPGTIREGELPSRIAQHAQSLRFVSQLTARRHEAYSYSKPAFALGGVRTALWSNEMPVEATALALWAVAETAISLERVASRNAP
ncbi:MAG: hypothetical protein AAGI53_12255 [Planctomycetota bacterium]